MQVKEPYSPVFLAAAEHFTGQAAELEDAHDVGGELVGDQRMSAGSLHRMYVVNVFTNLRSFLEANVNEFYHHLQDYVSHVEDGNVRTESDLPLSRDSMELLANLAASTDGAFGRKPLLEKYQRLLVYANATPFDRGAQPFQNVAHVTNVRNFFAHYEPEWIELTAGEEYEHALERLMEAQGVGTNPLAVDDARFPTKYLSVDCAEWAIDSCLAFTDEFHDRTTVDPRYEGLRG